MPVRASPTIGGSFRSAAIMGSTVKPIARRSGATSSRPLQIVGVSQRLRISRSAAVKGRLAMGGFLSGIKGWRKANSTGLDADLTLLEPIDDGGALAVDPGGDKNDCAIHQRVEIGVGV